MDLACVVLKKSNFIHSFDFISFQMRTEENYLTDTQQDSAPAGATQ